MMIELKLQAAASVTPVRAMGCMHAKQCEAALPPTPRARKAQAEGEKGGRDDERAEAAGGSECHACEGNELHAPSSARAAQAEGEGNGRDDEKAEAAAAASITLVRAMGDMRAKQCEVALPPKPRARKAQAEGYELHAPRGVRRPVPPKPRAGTAAERMSELKLQARRAPRLSGQRAARSPSSARRPVPPKREQRPR